MTKLFYGDFWAELTTIVQKSLGRTADTFPRVWLEYLVLRIPGSNKKTIGCLVIVEAELRTMMCLVFAEESWAELNP